MDVERDHVERDRWFVQKFPPTGRRRGGARQVAVWMSSVHDERYGTRFRILFMFVAGGGVDVERAHGGGGPPQAAPHPQGATNEQRHTHIYLHL